MLWWQTLHDLIVSNYWKNMNLHMQCQVFFGDSDMFIGCVPPPDLRIVKRLVLDRDWALLMDEVENGNDVSVSSLNCLF